MNEPNRPNVPGQRSGVSSQKTTRPRNPLLRIIVSLVASGVLAVVAYSIYVSVHEPDRQETVVLGQTKIAAGSPAALRIVVRDRVSGMPVKGAQVALSLLGKAAPAIKLGAFQTDASGSIADPIQVPALPPGEYQLTVDSTSSLGRDHIVKKVEVQNPARVLLSSDKPIYQPGQTIHLRTLLLNGRTQKPFTNETVAFEVGDPKGNKVFKASRKSSAFGIASADFVLASELNLGRYEIRAIAGAVTTERTVEIKNYVLPKFKIRIATDKPYYLPGQTVSGSVQAGYFFGKPVSDGTVKLTASTIQEKPVVLAEARGRTDSGGRFSFQFVLPDFLVGMPQNKEQAYLDLTAEIADAAQHQEKTTLSLSVAKSELELAAIPEAGVLVPGVENYLYVLTEYPDGRPAVCKTFVNGIAYESDSQGVTRVKLVPSDANQQVEIQALDASGRKAKLTYKPDHRGTVPAFLLRTDKAVYQAGGQAQVTVLSADKVGAVFLDVIKDNQTVLTRSVSLANHRAEYALPLPASLVGALKLNAYVITPTGEDQGCSRLLYVNPASGLQIAASWSKPVYAPGEIAKVNFGVTDAQGRPAPAALGIAAVDESVFALSENRPGLLQQFMDAEGELMKPRYQIKFFDSADLGLSLPGDRQALFQACLSSLDQAPGGPGIEDLVKSGYIPQQLIDNARQMRGTPAYENLRKDPQYAGMIRLLEGERGLYNLREATGAAKLQAVEAHRKAYYKNLEHYLQIGFCALLFLLPISLLIYYSRPGAGIIPLALAEGQTARYAALAGSLQNHLAVLTLLPLVCYPAAGFALAGSRMDEPWSILVLTGFETVAVLLVALFQYIRIAKARAEYLKSELAPLQIFLAVFLGQFVASRTGFALMFFHPAAGGGFIVIWFFASLIAPLLVLGALAFHVRGKLAAEGISARVASMTFVEVLIVISVLFILAAVMTPNFVRARTTSQMNALISDLRVLDSASATAAMEGTKPGAGSPASPRIRRDFPETLFWRPELITDDQGRATLEIPLADSITTWRASVDAISASGKMGSIETPITVFQDFFADLDLPASMSLGDEVTVPVTCYNYLKEPQDIRLHLAAADWFESPAQDLSVHLAANEVKGASFPIKVLRVGNHALRVTAQGSKIADAVEREIRVVPVGERIENTKNEVLKDNFAETFTIPAETIPDSQSLWIKVYPSRFSEIVEGLDSIFQQPYGCFEQTSSTTYPNVLALDYLKRMGRLTPEVEVKARKFINAGYQRLLTFEVPGGGFEWFGHDPAHVGLTAFGILEFTDMSQVHPVDQDMIKRTKKWLLSKQRADGSWDWSGGLEYLSTETPATAYVAWALAESGDDSPALDKALGFLHSHPEKLSNNYQKGLAANAFLARNRTDSFGLELLDQLKAAAIKDDKLTHWPSMGYSMTYSHDSGMAVETTALCTMALMKAGTSPELVKQALTWLSKQKEAGGTWGSTQATILAMRALIQGSGASLGQDFASTIAVLLNGQTITTFQINKDNSDVMKQVELTQYLHAGNNQIELRQTPGGELPVQCTGAYWLPNPASAATAAARPADLLQIDLQYDRTTLAVDDQLKCAVSVKNNTGQGINMAIVDLGIPPGFEVDTTSFEAMRQAGRIAKFELTGNQAILYLRELSNTAPFQFDYALRAKYPLRVQTPPSKVYEYYQPANRAESRATVLQVASSPTQP